jgi:hypothetical protein
MDRGLDLFAGLNVLPKTAWMSSFLTNCLGRGGSSLHLPNTTEKTAKEHFGFILHY